LLRCSVSDASSIYLNRDPETVTPSGDRQVVYCPLELVRDPVRGGRTRFPALRESEKPCFAPHQGVRKEFD